MTNAQKFWTIVVILFTLFVSPIPFYIILFVYIFFCILSLIFDLGKDNIIQSEYNIISYINKFLNKWT